MLLQTTASYLISFHLGELKIAVGAVHILKTWEKKGCSPTLSAVMVQTLAELTGALQTVILSVKSAQTCFIMNQAQKQN